MTITTTYEAVLNIIRARLALDISLADNADAARLLCDDSDAALRSAIDGAWPAVAYAPRRRSPCRAADNGNRRTRRSSARARSGLLSRSRRGSCPRSACRHPRRRGGNSRPLFRDGPKGRRARSGNRRRHERLQSAANSRTSCENSAYRSLHLISGGDA